MTPLIWRSLTRLGGLVLTPPGRDPTPWPRLEEPEPLPLPPVLDHAVDGLLGWFAWFVGACAVGALLYVGFTLGLAWLNPDRDVPLVLGRLSRVLWACVIAGNAAAVATALIFLPDADQAIQAVEDLVRSVFAIRMPDGY